MSKEAKITIGISIVGLVIAYLAWQYPRFQPQDNQNNSNNNRNTNRNGNGNDNRPPRVIPPQVLARYEDRGVLVELNLCTIEGNTVTCECSIENTSQTDCDIWLFTSDYYDVGSKLYDEAGQEYRTSNIKFGNNYNEGRSDVKLFALPNTKLHAVIKFQGVNPQASSISRLRLRVGIAKPNQHIYGNLDATFEAQLKSRDGNIPLIR